MFGGVGNGLEGTQALLATARDGLMYLMCARWRKPNTCYYRELNSTGEGERKVPPL